MPDTENTINAYRWFHSDNAGDEGDYWALLAHDGDDASPAYAILAKTDTGYSIDCAQVSAPYRTARLHGCDLETAKRVALTMASNVRIGA